jgi:hypothetical protein
MNGSSHGEWIKLEAFLSREKWNVAAAQRDAFSSDQDMAVAARGQRGDRDVDPIKTAGTYKMKRFHEHVLFD